MILIADCGSTKSAWKLIPKQGAPSNRLTPGFNPYLHTSKQIMAFLREGFASIPENETVTQVYFYGAGCSTAERNNRVEDALATIFPRASLAVGHDMLGAARAACQHEAGFVAILGTGSNSCFYDGKEIRKNVPSLGYLLSDEGSGNYLGKLLVKAFLMGDLPPVLDKQFVERFQIDRINFLSSIYDHPRPNAYLAQFAIFFAENRNESALEAMINRSFRDFIEQILLRYDHIKHHPIHVVGSIGYHYQEQLKAQCETAGLRTGNFIPNPLDALVDFHQSNPH